MNARDPSEMTKYIQMRISILPFHPTVYSSYIFSPPFSPLSSQSRAEVVVSSALSRHPSSGSSGFQRILQTSPFIHFPLRARRRQPRAGPTSAGTPILLPDLLCCYPVFFFRGEGYRYTLAPSPHSSHARWFLCIYMYTKFASGSRSFVSRDRSHGDKAMSAPAGQVLPGYAKHRSRGARRIHVRDHFGYCERGAIKISRSPCLRSIGV